MTITIRKIFCFTAICIYTVFSSCKQQAAQSESAFIIDSTMTAGLQISSRDSSRGRPVPMAMEMPDRTEKGAKQQGFKLSDFDTLHAGGNIYYIVDGDLAVNASQLQQRLAINRKNDTLKFRAPQQQLTEKAIIVRNQDGI